MSKKTSYKIYPIGFVRKAQGSFMLEIHEEYRPALKQLDGFSHLHVFWWCHLYDQEEHRKILICDRPYKTAPSKIGVFATRSPLRPNPIALTVVAVLNINLDEGRIHIPYIDAEHDTPIIDVKPYHPSTDRIRNVSVPEWCHHWPQWYEDSANFDWEAEMTGN
jgi:tRNA-Thr(GGU) m(6)t(6)A37 methyltransferase TsaA